MFTINDDLSIYATRGDTVFFTVTADENGVPYKFQAGDVLRIKIFGKKDAENVVLEKSFPVTAETDKFTILLTEEDTKIGAVISKATDYWYEIELNPFTNPQTIIGYDEDGAKIFRLFPEGKDSEVVDPDPEDIPIVDDELDMTSTRPVQNQAIARAIVNLEAVYKLSELKNAEKISNQNINLVSFGNEIDLQNSRIDNFVSGSTSDGSEIADVRVGTDGHIYNAAGTAIRTQLNEKANKIYHKRDVVAELAEGSLYNVDSKTTLTANRGNHLVYTLQGEKRLLVNGYMWANENFPLIAFLDADGNVLSRFGETNTAYSNVEIRVPDYATTVICNGETNSVAMIIDMYEERDVEKEIDSIVDSVGLLEEKKMGKLYTTEEVECDYTDEYVYNILDNSTLENAGGNYASYTLNGETELLVTGMSWVTNSKFPLYALMDSNDKVISAYGDSSVQYTDVSVRIPGNAVKIVVNGIMDNPARIKRLVERNIDKELDESRRYGMLNHWFGKKVVFLGTSVTHGALAETSYAFEAAKKLGFNLVNTGKPGMAITIDEDGSMMKYGSSTLTKEEYAKQGEPVQSIAPEGYDFPNAACNDFYMSWENIFSTENADADLWVFDVIPNNSNFSLTDYDNFDKENWMYKDGSDFADHRTTFLGALIYLMDKMYTLNPYARMVIMIGSGIALSSAARVCLDKLKSDWNIAVIDLWGKINTSPKSYEKLTGDDPHPSTFAHEIMGNMLAHELLLVN